MVVEKVGGLPIASLRLPSGPPVEGWGKGIGIRRTHGRLEAETGRGRRGKSVQKEDRKRTPDRSHIQANYRPPVREGSGGGPGISLADATAPCLRGGGSDDPARPFNRGSQSVWIDQRFAVAQLAWGVQQLCLPAVVLAPSFRPGRRRRVRYSAPAP